MQPIPPQVFTLPFIRKAQVAKDAYSFFFDRSKFSFDNYPGQYIRITIPHDNKDERGDGRFFTIASSPIVKNELMITTRIIQSSFKHKLTSLTQGQEVNFFGPIGRFIFDETESNPRIFISGGIGITPFHSIITYICQRKLSTPVTLFASFTTPEDFVFFDEMTKISQELPNIKIVYTVTKPELSVAKWSGETGRVTESMIRKYVPNTTSCISMTCGPAAMLNAIVQLITDMGIPVENIRKEVFTGY